MVYRVEIKHRAKPPRPYKWEIYKDNDPIWVERSMDSYASREDALRDGEVARQRLENHASLNKGG
jgi:hypothetical protein